MKLIKVLVLLFIAAAFISVGAQTALMLAIGWAFLLTLNYKVS